MQWQFWRWRPKLSLCTFQILALLTGSIVLVYLRSQPWRATMTLGGKTFPLTAVCFSGDGKQIMTAGGDGTTRIYDADTGAQKYLRDFKERILTADLSPDGTRIVAATETGTIEVFDAATGATITNLDRRPMPSQPMPFTASVRFSPDGESVVLASQPPFSQATVILFSMAGRYDGFHVFSNSLSSARFTSGNKSVITATEDGIVQVWDLAKTEAIVCVHGDVDIFRSAVFSPDGKFIATAGKDCSVRLWNACFGEETRSMIEPPPVDSVESAKGRLWFAKSIVTMKGHQQYVLSAQFSPDGERLATVSLDGSVRVWGGRDGAALAVLSKQGPWRSVIFSPDGKRIAAGGMDGSVQVWNQHCVERWYGKLMLPEFWLLFLIVPALFWSIRRDARSLGMKSSIVGVDPNTQSGQ